MKLILGPILYAGVPDPGTWNFRINMLFQGVRADAPPPVSVTSGSEATIGPPTVAADFTAEGGYVYWSWPVSVRRELAEKWFSYDVTSSDGVEGLPDGPVTDVCIPARGCLPRMAFFSCNGVSSEKQFHQLADPEALWTDIMTRHLRAKRKPTPDHPGGYHLLVGGGDQIYADALWDDEPLLSLGKKKVKDRVRQKADAAFVAAVRKMYVELYPKRWQHPGMQSVMSRVPGVFTWDDHDIFDGWGSHEPELQASPCYRAIFDAASRAFEAFQLGGIGSPNRIGGPHYLQALGFHETDRHLDLVLLDLRRDRSREQVISAQQWKDLRAWLDAHAQPADGVQRHLVVVSSIPLVYMKLDVANYLPDVGGLEDDRIDQWEHRNHRGERALLLMRLLEHGARANCQITILSGDVHVGSRGRVVSTVPQHLPAGRSKAVMHQITSSGIMNPPPSFFEWKAITLLGTEGRDTLADDVFAEVVDVTSGTRYLRARNWLSAMLDEPDPSAPDARVRLWMKWYTEKGGIEPQAVVE